MATVKMGEYFTLTELTRSAGGERAGLSNMPTAEAMRDMRNLVRYILDPLRRAAGQPVIITSCYRSPAVNRVVGGASTSQHMLGQAADLNVKGLTSEQTVALIRKLNLPFDQLIEEFGQWVHVSYGPRNRKQVLRARKVNGRTVYTSM